MTCKAFLDSNILFSAILSPQGAARRILLLSAQEAIQAVISQQVVEEVRRNLTRKYPEFLNFLLVG
jgi:predicted nucleic acid-binding protein